ncbi:alkyl sulfatase C-terminal domain-containing protein [Williamsia sp. R60]
MLDKESLRGVTAKFEFNVGNSVATLQLQDGFPRVQAGSPETPADAVIWTEPPTMAAIAGNRMTVTEAIENGLVKIDGDPDALKSLLEMLEASLAQRSGA